MEQDLEDFDTWDASELDHLALDVFTGNLAENLDLFSNDGVPGLSNLVDGPVPSSIPVAESANPNIDSVDPLPSLDEFDKLDFPNDLSEVLPPPTQTTSSMQVPQSGNPTGDELFRFVNLDADASYTDHHPSESLAPIATADSVPVAQSTDLTGNDMSAFDDMDLDAPYGDIGFSRFLSPTTTTSLIQAALSADFVGDGTSRIIELNPDPVIAPSGPAPTSSEQLPPPVSTDRVSPTEIAHLANLRTNFNGSGSPNPSYLTSILHPFAFSSNEITTAMPTPGNQLRLGSGNSFPSGGYVPIQPKPAAISRITELPRTSEPQDSSLSRFPSQTTLASRPASSVSKGKRKRQRSPQARPSAYKDCLHEFSIAAEGERHQQPATKRMKSAKTCLRCQIQNKRVHGLYTLRKLSWADMSVVFGRFPL